jgi:hypothetical protein
VRRACRSPLCPQGYLLPDFIGAYWIGLRATEEEPQNFQWLDKLIVGPTSTSYRHWADTGEADMSGKLCAVANYTTAYGMSSAVQPWGWMPDDCTTRRPYLCRQAREWLAGWLAGCCSYRSCC